MFVEYAKADQEDILCRVTAINRGPEPAELHVLPHAWFRNTWSWGHDPRRPELRADGPGRVRAEHRHLGERWWYVDAEPRTPELLFTENETNAERLFGVPNASPYVKDAFHEYVVGGRRDRVNPGAEGDEGRGALPRDGSTPASRSPSAPDSPTARSTTPSATSTRSSTGGSPRPTRSTRPSSPRA